MSISAAHGRSLGGARRARSTRSARNTANARGCGGTHTPCTIRDPRAIRGTAGRGAKGLLIIGILGGLLVFSACAPLPGLRSGPHLDSPTAWQATLPHLEQAAAEHPEHPDRLAELSIAYFFAERFLAADSTAARALDLASSHGLARYTQALLLERAGNWAGADSIYRHVEDYTAVDSDLRRVMVARHEIASRQIIREQMRTELTEAAARSPHLEPQALIIRGFQPLGGTHRDSVVAVGITHFLTSAFAQIDSLTVIDRTRRRLLEEEIVRSQGAAYSEDARLAARTIGAGLSLAGRAGESIAEQEQVLVQYDLDDLIVGRDESAYRGTPRLVEFSTPRRYLLDDLGRHVVTIATERLRLPVSRRVRTRLSRPPTENYEAFIAFAEGLLWENEGNYGRAYSHFREAARIDPGFDWAISGADRVAGAGDRGEAVVPGGARPSAGEEAYADRAAEIAAEWVDEFPGERPEDPEPLSPRQLGRRVTITVRPR